ncbi:MAG: hypothetical protein VSS75_010365, partial [Candidatus Parabeggiatoa sp.]|nr:hypothetical protein [Candidatus Parabeggiatoa sp.]
LLLTKSVIHSQTRYFLVEIVMTVRHVCQMRRFAMIWLFILILIPSVKKSGTGYFFSTENQMEIPAESSDIILKGSHLSSIYPFIDTISQYGIVHTDRLHVAIVGCLLGLEVHLYAGADSKKKAVYLSSIEDYYDNVYFHVPRRVDT